MTQTSIVVHAVRYGYTATPLIHQNAPNPSTCILLTDADYAVQILGQDRLKGSGGQFVNPLGGNPVFFGLEVVVPGVLPDGTSDPTGTALYRAVFTNDPQHYGAGPYGRTYDLREIDPTGPWATLTTDATGDVPSFSLNLSEAPWNRDPVVAALSQARAAENPLLIEASALISTPGEFNNSDFAAWLSLPPRSTLATGLGITAYDACILAGKLCPAVVTRWPHAATKGEIAAVLGCGPTPSPLG